MVVIVGVLLLEFISTSALNPLWLSLLVVLLLRPFLIVTRSLVLVVFFGVNLVTLLLHPIGLLALVALCLIFTLATHTAEFFVTLDEIVQALVVHLEIHSKGAFSVKI